MKGTIKNLSITLVVFYLFLNVTYSDSKIKLFDKINDQSEDTSIIFNNQQYIPDIDYEINLLKSISPEKVEKDLLNIPIMQVLKMENKSNIKIYAFKISNSNEYKIIDDKTLFYLNDMICIPPSINIKFQYSNGMILVKENDNLCVFKILSDTEVYQQYGHISYIKEKNENKSIENKSPGSDISKRFRLIDKLASNFYVKSTVVNLGVRGTKFDFYILDKINKKFRFKSFTTQVSQGSVNISPSEKKANCIVYSIFGQIKVKKDKLWVNVLPNQLLNENDIIQIPYDKSEPPFLVIKVNEKLFTLYHAGEFLLKSLLDDRLLAKGGTDEVNILIEYTGQVYEVMKRALSFKNKNLKLFGSSDGLVVIQVHPKTQAEKLGIKPGDILLSYNKVPLKTAKQFFEIPTIDKDKSKIPLELFRGDYSNKETIMLDPGIIGVTVLEFTDLDDKKIIIEPEKTTTKAYLD